MELKDGPIFSPYATFNLSVLILNGIERIIIITDGEDEFDMLILNGIERV